MIRTVVIGLAVLVAALIVWSYARKSQTPEVRFFRARTQTLTSTLETNGKAEPVEWASARAAIAGTVEKVYVERGQKVKKDAALVSIDPRQATADLATANAQIEAAKAAERLLKNGGRPVELADIESKLARAKLDLQTAERDQASFQRLLAKQAATRKEVTDADERVRQAQIQIQALEQRRQTLIAPEDRSAAQSKLLEAEASATLARRNLALSVVRSPMEGILYQFDVHPGAYLEAGALVGSVGKLDQVRVIIYVDDVDLGRVSKDMPVLITWDALPGRQWRGRVDKPATQVIALNTRQVGEVSSIVENPDHDLLPGTNINAEIEAGSVDALSIPKEAIRRHNEQTGVLLLKGERIVWQPIELGVSTLMRAQVKKGLKEGDAIAGPSDLPLQNGMKVNPVFE